RLAKPRRAEQRREALAERRDVGRVAHRQQLVVPPERRLAGGKLLAAQCAPDGAEVVAGEHHFAAGRADVLRPVDLMRAPAARALEPVEVAIHAGRAYHRSTLTRWTSARRSCPTG